MHTVSVSKIESFYSYQNGIYGDYESLLKDIMGIKTFKAVFDIGNLIDAYMNDALVNTTTYQALEQKFKLKLHEEAKYEMSKWADGFKETNPVFAVQEEKSKLYQTNYGPINITMKADITCPRIMKDVKSSQYGMSYENYLSKIQGLFYLNAFEKDYLDYEHFKVSHKTLRVNYGGFTRQMPAQAGYIESILNSFMSFVMTNNLSVFINKPEVYELSSFIFAPKHWYKTVEQVLKTDPGYIKWMHSKGYPLSQDVILNLNK